MSQVLWAMCFYPEIPEAMFHTSECSCQPIDVRYAEVLQLRNFHRPLTRAIAFRIYGELQIRPWPSCDNVSISKAYSIRSSTHDGEHTALSSDTKGGAVGVELIDGLRGTSG